MSLDDFELPCQPFCPESVRLSAQMVEVMEPGSRRVRMTIVRQLLPAPEVRPPTANGNTRKSAMHYITYTHNVGICIAPSEDRGKE